jgi:hypothetical protein
MTRDNKDNITVCSAIAMLIFGTVLTTIGFFLEPMGEVHDSVLWVLGQCFIYAGGALGIANYSRSVAKQEIDDYMRRHHPPRHGHDMDEQEGEYNDGDAVAHETEEDEE